MWVCLPVRNKEIFRKFRKKSGQKDVSQKHKNRPKTEYRILL